MTKKTLYVLIAVVMITAMVASCAPQATPTSAPPPTTAPSQATQPPQPTQPPAPTTPPPTAAPTKAPAPKILRYQAPEPQMEPDMAKSNTSISITFSGFLNDYLIGYTQDNKVIYMLAEKYEPNADFSVWSVKLRDNAKFSDGTDVTTADLVWSINHYKAFDTQKSVYNLVKEVEVVDAKNAKIHLTEPHSDWLFLHPTAVYSKACDAGCDFYSPKTPTSGPWMMKEYIQKDHMTMVKNPNYWGLKEADPFPKIDQVNWVFQSDMTSSMAAVEAGEQDWSYVVPKDAKRLGANPSLNLLVLFGNDGFVGFAFDKTKPPFSDVKVRQAVGMMLDPKQKTSACWDGYALDIYGGYIYREDAGWSDLYIDTWEKMSKADKVAEAGKLLDSAGWVVPSGGTARVSKGVAGIADGTKFSVQVDYESNWPQAECHTLLLKDWGAQVGLDFKPNSYDPNAFWGDAIAGKHAMWHIGLPSSLLPYARFRSLFETGGSFVKYGAWVSDPVLDKMIDAANTEQDPTKKHDLVKQTQDYLFQQQYMVVDGAQNAVFAVNKAIKGMYVGKDPMNSQRAWIFADIQR